MTHRPAIVACLMAALAAPVAADTPSFLWKVSGEGPGTVYLLGTVHLLKPEGGELSPAMESAYADADRLVVEVDLDRLEDAAAALLAAGMLPTDTSLDKMVDAETWAGVQKLAEGGAMPVQMLARFRPWLVAMTLTVEQLRRAGYTDALGVDRRLLTRARKDGKEVVALETTEEQIGLFADLPPEEDEAFLAATLAEMEQLESLMDQLTTAWRSGDVDRAAELLAEGFAQAPGLYQRLVVARNEAWLPVVEGFLAKPGTTLVAVGALHFVGEHGLVEALKARGHRVEQR